MKQRLVLSVASVATITLLVGANTIYAATTKGQGIPQQIQQLTNEMKSILQTVTGQKDQVSKLQQTVIQQADEVSALRKTANQQAQQIQSLQTTVGNQSDSIASLTSKLSHDDRVIYDLQNSQSSEDEQISRLNSEMSQLQQEISALQSGGTTPVPPSPPQGTNTISGTLTDSQGTPFFSPLYLVNSNGQSVEEQTTFNSATGEFSFTNVPDGTYTFKFGMPEYLFTSPQVTVSGQNVTGLNLHTNNPVYDISGVATKNGQPLSNQDIIIYDPYGYTGGYFGPGQTNSNGDFSLHGIPNGTYIIYIGLDLGKSPVDPSTALASGTVTVNNGDLTNVVLNGS